MYTITRGPSKLVTQRRTGPTQQFDNKINDLKHKQASRNTPDLPAPKIVFSRLNGKKYQQPAPALPSDGPQEENLTPAHEENVKFVNEVWQQVVLEDQGPSQGPDQGPSQGPNQSSDDARGAVHYREASPSPHMDNFVAIDLDEWWAQRFLANIDKLS